MTSFKQAVQEKEYRSLEMRKKKRELPKKKLEKIDLSTLCMKNHQTIQICQRLSNELVKLNRLDSNLNWGYPDSSLDLFKLNIKTKSTQLLSNPMDHQSLLIQLFSINYVHIIKDEYLNQRTLFFIYLLTSLSLRSFLWMMLSRDFTKSNYSLLKLIKFKS